MNVESLGIFCGRGTITCKGEQDITKKDNVEGAIKELIAQGEWETVYTSILSQVPAARLSLLWDIFMETDLTDFNQLEEKIYLYGKSLGSKDYYGRKMFTRMAMVLRIAQNVNR